MEVFSILGFLTIFPLGAFIIGALYIRMYTKLSAKMSLVTGVLWMLYSLYEYLMYARVLCSGECNIRIDLLLIYPLLVLMAVISSFLYYRRMSKLGDGSRS